MIRLSALHLYKGTYDPAKESAGLFQVRQEFAEPDYHMNEDDGWVRIEHAVTKREVLVPREAVAFALPWLEPAKPSRAVKEVRKP